MKPKATTIVRVDRDGRPIEAINALLVFSALSLKVPFMEWLQETKIGKARGFDFFYGAPIGPDDGGNGVPPTLFSVDLVYDLVENAGLEMIVRGDDVRIGKPAQAKEVAVKSEPSALSALDSRFEQLMLNSERMLSALSVTQSQVVVLNGVVSAMKPKADFVDAFVEDDDDDDTYGLMDASRAFGLPSRALGKLLREKCYLMDDNTPYADYREHGRGYFVVKISDKKHHGKKRKSTRITHKGMVHIGRRLLAGRSFVAKSDLAKDLFDEAA